jgi:hypothetical protein
MKSNNSTGGFTEIASVAMQALDKRSFFDGAGRNITVVPNSLDFSDTLKFGTLGAEFVFMILVFIDILNQYIKYNYIRLYHNNPSISRFANSKNIHMLSGLY